MQSQAFDTIVVGAGSMGMAAGHFLSRAGQKVLLIDAGDPPHDIGAHHGSTRLIRHAYGEGAAYVPLVLRAQQLWLELERDTGTQIFTGTGVVNIGPSDSPFIREVERSASQYGLSLEVLDSAEIGKRWPAWHVSPEQIACFEPDAGVLYCEQAVRSYRRMAEHNGATLRANASVTRIESHDNGDIGIIDEYGERFIAHDVIVCAGKWTRALLAPLGMTTPVSRVRKTFAWFDADPAMFAADVFPGFAVTSEASGFYGFPDLDGSGFKIGRHDGGQAVSPDASLAPFGALSTDAEDLEHFVRRYLPDVGKLRIGKVCEYDMTPDEHFIIDRVPAHPHLHVATGFSGHGFKFASAIGEALAQRIVQGESELDLSLFALDRFAARR